MTSFHNAQNFNYLIAFFRGLFHQARKNAKMSYLPLRLLSISLSNNDGIDGFAFQLCLPGYDYEQLKSTNKMYFSKCTY